MLERFLTATPAADIDAAAIATEAEDCANTIAAEAEDCADTSATEAETLAALAALCADATPWEEPCESAAMAPAALCESDAMTMEALELTEDTSGEHSGRGTWVRT